VSLCRARLDSGAFLHLHTWRLADECQPAGSKPDGIIVVQNSGGYIARFSVLYDYGGQTNRFDSGNFPALDARVFETPGTATNVYLTIQVLVFIESWTTIYEEYVGPSDKICLSVGGTTLSPTYVFC
jgi:hypothetical protein